jgi:hypothetical protein
MQGESITTEDSLMSTLSRSLLLFASLVLVSRTASAETASVESPSIGAKSTTSLGVYSGLGYLGVHDVNGAAFLVGSRLAVSRHVAFAFDFGWGAQKVVDSAAVQDRWWLMPSAAFVIPVGVARIDLGVGLGVATTSGYDSSSTFFAAPFAPKWAFQLNPAGRLQAAVMVPVTDRVDLYARTETGTLFGNGTVGIHEGNEDPPLRDVSWAALFIGAHVRAW